jgi:hypothetical protein
VVRPRRHDVFLDIDELNRIDIVDGGTPRNRTLVRLRGSSTGTRFSAAVTGSPDDPHPFIRGNDAHHMGMTSGDGSTTGPHVAAEARRLLWRSTGVHVARPVR